MGESEAAKIGHLAWVQGVVLWQNLGQNSGACREKTTDMQPKLGNHQ